MWFVDSVDLLLNPLTVRHSKPSDFTPGQLMPASVVLDCKDGVYAIDSAYDGKNDPEKNVLTWLVGCAFGLKGI